MANPFDIDSLDALPDLRFCCDHPDAGLRHRFMEVVGSIGVGNVFNPSFLEGRAVRVFAFRAIPDGSRELESFVSVEDRSGRTLIRLSPERFPDIAAPRLIDPKVFCVGEEVYVTFHSGWVPTGRNDIFVMRIYPGLDEPKKVVYPTRQREERNWGFFSEHGQIYAIYRIAPLVILKLEKASAKEWRMVDHVRREDACVPSDLTLGSQPSGHGGRHYFVAHRKYLLRRKKVYVGRLCVLDTGDMSVTAGADWMVHSQDSLRGSDVKHNTNLHSCTYFSGLQASDSGITLGYGINDVDFGFSRFRALPT